MSNPFEAYLPLYGEGVVRERPWWRYIPPHDGWTRADGKRSKGLPASAFTIDNGPGEGRSAPHEVVLAHLDAYDAAHPLPAPPPLCGQVWAWPKGCMTIGATYDNGPDPETGAQRVSAEWIGNAHWATGWDRFSVEPNLRIWPPPNAVLVHGPLAPWAPPGWISPG